MPYAIGPNIVMKHPSNKPSSKERMTMEGYAATPSNGDAVKSIVHMPVETNDICCKKTGLTFEWSAIFPKTILPTKEVAAMHVTRNSPL